MAHIVPTVLRNPQYCIAAVRCRTSTAVPSSVNSPVWHAERNANSLVGSRERTTLSASFREAQTTPQMVSLSLMTRDRETIQHPVTWEIGELMTEVSLRLLSIHGLGSCERFSMFFFWGGRRGSANCLY